MSLAKKIRGNNLKMKQDYRTRASINRSQLVTAPLNFHWKNNFLFLFYVKTDRLKKYFLVINRG